MSYYPDPELMERFGAEDLLLPREVAQLFRVDPKTVTRWTKSGKLTCVRTLGGHRRYPAAEVRALLRRTLEGRLVDEAKAS